VIGDTTGYGVDAVAKSVAGFKADGANVVYSATIDATQADVTPDLLRMKDAGAEVIVMWTTSNGLEARMLNARAAKGWDVPVAGHPTLGSGEVKKLLDKPENWNKVYVVSFRSVMRNDAGKLPATTQAFLDESKGKIDLSYTLLFFPLIGVDEIALFTAAVTETGSTDGVKLAEYFNHLKDFKGVFGNYTFSPTEHNGFALDSVQLGQANTAAEGVMKAAPGYS
jgi:branched-chain amino acid transport system substrate-binding protein